MTSTTIKMLDKDGKCYGKVRFYSSGIYTITDSGNYEHETGEWEKRPLILRNGKYSKTKFLYEGHVWCGKRYMEYSLKDLANLLYKNSLYYECKRVKEIGK